MNAVVPAKPALQTGATVAAIVPRSFEEAFRLANAFSASGLAPRGMDKPEQVAVAIIAGAELGLPPFQAIQSFAVVNGRPTIWGDGMVAVVRAQGVKIREWHEGDTAFAEVTRPDTGETIVRSFSQADAKTAGLAGKQGPWSQYPARMRAMRARSWALRDGCADFLRGFQMREEVEDYGTVQEVRATPAETLAIESAAAPAVIEVVPAPDAEEHQSEAASPATEDAELSPAASATAPQTSDEDLFPGDAPLREG